MTAPSNIESLDAARARSQLVRLGSLESFERVAPHEASVTRLRRLRIVKARPDTRSTQSVGDD